MASLTLSISVALVMLQPAATADATTRTIAKIAALKVAVARYRSFAGSAPTSLDALVNPPAGATCAPDVNPSSATFRQLRGWCGPYVPTEFGDNFMRDAWGTLLNFTTTIRSCGPNRSCGDGDDINVPD